MAIDIDRHRYVTNEELDRKLEKVDEKIDRLPTIWQVRFLILAGLIASQLIPAQDFAHAAIRLVLP